MATAKDVGMNLRIGSTGTVGSPGFVKIATRLAEALLENDGEIMTETPVENVVVTDKKVDGINIRAGKSNELIKADRVVCTIPVKHIF